MRDVYVVPRDCANPSKKGGLRKSNRESTKVWRVLTESEPTGSVYMAKTVGEKKCRLAWELDENNIVIQIDGDGMVDNYRTGEDLFGWKKLKELPSRNLEEEFGSKLSDEFIDRWDTTTGSSASASSARGSYDRDRAKKRRIKVRKGRGRGEYHTHTGESVHDALDSGETVQAKQYGTHIDTLVVVDQNDHNIRDYGHLCKNKTGQAVVPAYVKEYLLEADNVYEPEELRKEYYRKTIEPDWTASGHDESKPIGALWSDDVLFVVADGKSEWFEERLEQVRSVVDEWLHDHQSGYDTGDMNSFTILEPSDLSRYWVALLEDGNTWTSDSTLLYTSSRRALPGGTQSRARKFGLDDAELYLQIELPKDEFDRDSGEWHAIFGSNPSLTETTIDLVQVLQENQSCLDDDTSVFPSLRE